jgi:hypothetical protein
MALMARPIRDPYRSSQTIRLDVIASRVHDVLLLFARAAAAMFEGELSSLWTTRVFTEVAARKSLATQ